MKQIKLNNVIFIEEVLVIFNYLLGFPTVKSDGVANT